MSLGYTVKTTAEIKKALQARFPGTKFSVTRCRGTAYRWVDVRWTDGPTDEAVSSFCGQFNDTARDDIMTDLWCGSQYTSTHRDFSAGGYAWRILASFDLTNGLPSLAAMVNHVHEHARGDVASSLVNPDTQECSIRFYVKWQVDEVRKGFEALGCLVSTSADGLELTIWPAVEVARHGD